MFSKIASELSLDGNEAESFGRGLEAFMKTAGLDKKETSDFIKSAKEIRETIKIAEEKRSVFELGILKFAADADLDEAELARFSEACRVIAAKQ